MATKKASTTPVVETELRTPRSRKPAAVPIDFTRTLDESHLAASRRSVWNEKVAELIAGVNAGDGEYDTFYLIGEFNTASGARGVIRTFEKNPSKASQPIDMRARIVTESTSELWCSVLSPDDEPAEADVSDGDGDGDGDGYGYKVIEP